jgi:hypothetical protein
LKHVALTAAVGNHGHDPQQINLAVPVAIHDGSAYVLRCCKPIIGYQRRKKRPEDAFGSATHSGPCFLFAMVVGYLAGRE